MPNMWAQLTSKDPISGIVTLYYSQSQFKVTISVLSLPPPPCSVADQPHSETWPKTDGSGKASQTVLRPLQTTICRQTSKNSGQAEISRACKIEEQPTESCLHGQGGDPESRLEADSSNGLHSHPG